MKGSSLNVIFFGPQTTTFASLFVELWFDKEGDSIFDSTWTILFPIFRTSKFILNTSPTEALPGTSKKEKRKKKS